MPSLDHIIEVALLLLAAYLAGCGIGYGAHLAARWLRQARQRVPVQPAVQPAAPPQQSAARRLARLVEHEDSVPLPLTAHRPPERSTPRSGQGDDLKKIKGIGAKTESALQALGIHYYDQIAAWTPENIEWLEGRVAIKGRILREQWVDQAVLLATRSAAA